MHKTKQAYLAIKKAFMDLFFNKPLLFLWLIVGILIFFFPFINVNFLNKQNELSSQGFYQILKIMSIILIEQYVFDSTKKDFSEGTGDFIFNLRISPGCLSFGKLLVSFCVLVYLFLLRFDLIKECLTVKEIVYMAMFFSFIVYNSFFFTLLFFTTASSMISFCLINLIFFFVFFILNIIKFYFLKIFIIISLIIIFIKLIYLVYDSLRFRARI